MRKPNWSEPTALPTDAQVDAAAERLPGAYVVDSNVADHATGNPFDHTDPANDAPQPEDLPDAELHAVHNGEPVSLEANPLRAYLAALALDLLSGMATMNWQPTNSHVKGEVAAMMRAMARVLEHNYGADYMDALCQVGESATRIIGDLSIANSPLLGSKMGYFVEELVTEVLGG